ncbi:P-loop containing nucleoside triphosphate hydrolase protein [Phlyctochytrium arcticum]|nr:P-loop containing nucleoside triphosphate hydrolase protein [Phlyctochytrium arcticum]
MENPALVPVRVLLRLRPIQRHHVATVNSPATVTLQTAQSPRTFTFDSVYDSDADQETVWEGVQSAVDGVLEGVNGTILAYGQTSSGKTYTMGSDHTCDVPENIRGIIPRAVEKIFAGVEEAHSDDPDIKYVVKLSFLEIYQEQIRDLLMPSSDPKDLSIRKDRHGVTVVSGLSERVVNSAEECLNCLEMGAIERTTGDTQMHMNSSRSHAIFMLVVEQHQVGDEPCILRVSKLCLVDLAGSERLKRTRAEGIRFKESVKINSGLLALGNVISILGDSNSSKDRHVPYRESKLTRLLQDSLGGNAKTVMIACISPAEEDTEETLNTLKYADRARKIQNKPVVNIVNHHAVQLASMLDQIHVLEDRLKNEKDGRPRASSDEEEEHDDEGVGGEDREWVHGFMLELKARTAKGAKALKELEVVTRERDLLRNEMIALEQHLQDSNNQTSQAFADMDRLSSEHSQLSVKLMEAETRIQVLENEKADLVRDAGVLVDAVVGWMSGGEMTVAENIKGVVKRWRPDSGICLDRSGG